MRKRRRIQLDPELLKQLGDLQRRMRETDREIEIAIARANEAQRKLRAIYQRR